MNKGKSKNKKSKSKKNNSNNSSKNSKVNLKSNQSNSNEKKVNSNNKINSEKISNSKEKNLTKNKNSSNKVNITNNQYKMSKQNTNVSKKANTKKTNSNKNNSQKTNSSKKNSKKNNTNKKINSNIKKKSNNNVSKIKEESKIKYTENKSGDNKKQDKNKKTEIKVNENKNSSEKKSDVKVNKEDIKGKEKDKNIWKIFLISSLSIIVILLINIALFLNNYMKDTIQKNIYIDNIDVSNLSKEDAVNKLNENIEKIKNANIVYKYNDEEYDLNLEDIELEFLIEESVNEAKSIGKSSEIFKDIKDYYELLFGGNKNIELSYKYNQDYLNEKIKEIESNFYKEVTQSSYTTENDVLFIKNGSEGIKIDYDEFIKNINKVIQDKNISEKNNIPLIITKPSPINPEQIHSELYVEMENASYSIKPFEIHNEVRGVDFDVETLISMINDSPNQEEYELPLIITNPETTVDMLDLYNDVLGTCRTTYINNPNRTTNLRLAASKIDGFILMPGETFSYNEIVGERTYSAGYRNAAIYVNGEVEDGLAGRNLPNFINFI